MNKIKLLFLLILPISIISFTGFVKMDQKENQNMKEKMISAKVDSLLSQMTIEEKIGQMIQVDMLALENPEDITKYYIGSLLSGGDSDPKDITPKGWAEMYDNYQPYALKTRLKIPLIYGIDAVHGHNNVHGAVIFPHNIGLGATRNPELVERVAKAAAEEIRATGMNWTFAPCVAVARNERWGRTYESFGETPELAEQLGSAYVKGLQGEDLSAPNAVVSCTKHFVGDGGTTNGKDQGNTEVDEETLRKIHLPGYIAAIEADTKTIMVSFSSWNGDKLHGHKYLLTDVLKNELGFKGFLVSDWAAIDQLEGDYRSDIEKSINAGLDMVMIPFGPKAENNYVQFYNHLNDLVKEGKVSEERINDAVKRILAVKFESGLFENPFTNKSLTKNIGTPEHREVAREAVRESIVLLKNQNNALPLSKDVKNLLVLGKNADDIGAQCGGWTITWQGKNGDIVPGTTILNAIKNAVPNSKVTFSENGKTNEKEFDAVVVVLGEKPYAEMMGDISDLSLSKEDVELVKSAKKTGKPVITILISGRPLLIENVLDQTDAFIAAWLPGTEGTGVTDVLFGDHNFKGKLPHSWPKNMEQVPVNHGDANYSPLFEYGFGLKY